MYVFCVCGGVHGLLCEGEGVGVEQGFVVGLSGCVSLVVAGTGLEAAGAFWKLLAMLCVQGPGCFCR